jgi:hypothetical protein
VQHLLDLRGPGGLQVRELDTLTTFGSQERIAADFRRGRVFLVGDAAHAHSPIGGQGLNLGLQDVHNLAWKLAGVIDGRLDPAVLDTYAVERRHAAELTVANTGRFTRMFTLGPRAARARNAGWRLLEATGVLRRRLIPLLAGWRVQYPAGPLTAAAERGGRRARRVTAPGARTPHWAEQTAGPDPAPFRLVTTGPADGPLARAARDLAAQRPGLAVHRHVARPGASFLLLRPDGFVASSGAAPRDLHEAARLLADAAA